MVCINRTPIYFTPSQVVKTVTLSAQIKYQYVLRDLVPFYNLKNVKNAHGGVLLLLKLQVVFCLSRPYHFKFFKGCLRQILLGPFFNTLSHIILTVQYCFKSTGRHPATLLKVTLLHGLFLRFLNCKYCTKSRKASQIYKSYINFKQITLTTIWLKYFFTL